MRENRKIVLGVVAGGVLILGVALGAVAIGADSDPEGPVEPGIEQTVGVLTKAAGASDALPKVAAVEVRSFAPVGTDVGRSVRALETDAGRLYVTATPEGACLSMVGDDGASVTCLPTAAISEGSGKQAHGTVLEGCTAESPGDEPECDSAILYGIVPDGVDSVRVDSPGSAVGAVENNAYMFRVAADDAMAPVEYR